MSQVQIIEADSPRLVKEFIRVPGKIYQGDPHYVPHLHAERSEFLDRKKNPFFSGARVKLFLAKRGEETVGRISTCVYFAHNELHEEKVGFFGFFDTIDDSEVSEALLKVALITLKQEGMEKMRGPASFSLNHECGMLVKGYDSSPVVMMTYNRPYQLKLAEDFGLEKVMDLYAFRVTPESLESERTERIMKRMQKRARITIRSLNMSRFEQEIELISEVYDKAWVHNWGFVPMTPAEFRYTAKQMKQIVDPSLALLALIDDKPVGFALSLPNINDALKYLDGSLFPFGLFKLLWHTKVKNKVKGIRTIMLGVIPEFQKRGIDNLLYTKTYLTGMARGYEYCEISWVLETNKQMLSIIESLGADHYKTYRMLEISI